METSATVLFDGGAPADEDSSATVEAGHDDTDEPQSVMVAKVVDSTVLVMSAETIAAAAAIKVTVENCIVLVVY